MKPSWLPPLVACFVPLFVLFQANAQPLIGRAESLDVTVANADRVLIGKLMEFDEQSRADEFGRRSGTVAVEETLKGEHQPRLRILFSDHVSVLAEWKLRSSRLLVSAQDGPPIVSAVIELSSGKLEVFTADFVLLRQPEEVIRMAKELIRHQPGVTRINAFGLRLPRSAIAGTKWAHNHGTSLSVPVDDRLKNWSSQHVASKNYWERETAAQALRYFKSDENVALVRPLLNDPEIGRLVTPNLSESWQVRVFIVRQAAHETLAYWGTAAERPIIREASRDRGPSDVRVTDADLLELARVENLQSLSLANTDVTDDSLKSVAQIKNLEILNLADTGITDAGLKHLAALNLLHYLDLAGTKVTDAGLRHLAGFKSLRKVILQRTEATPAAVAELRALRPDLEFER